MDFNVIVFEDIWELFVMFEIFVKIRNVMDMGNVLMVKMVFIVSVKLVLLVKNVSSMIFVLILYVLFFRNVLLRKVDIFVFV